MPTKHKRPVADSDDVTLSAPRQTRNHGNDEHETLLHELTGAMQHVGDSLQSRSPERHKAAINLLENDHTLEWLEEIRAMKLFTDNSSIAETFLNIKDKEKHAGFLQLYLSF